jgi:hypothetical protein
MVEQVVDTDPNVLFNLNKFDQLPVHIPRTIVQRHSEGQGAPLNEDGPRGNPEDHEREDALQPITDPLWKVPWWWIVEIVPIPYTFQGMMGTWLTTYW